MHFLRKHPFITGTLILTLTGFLSRLLGFVYRIYLSRIFGEEGMGVYQLLSPVLALTFSLCAAGLQTAISKYVAAEVSACKKGNAYRYLFVGLFISLALSLLCMGFILIFSEWISRRFLVEPRCASMLRIIALSVPVSSVHSCINGYYYGIKKTGVPSFTQLAEQICRILCILFAYRSAVKYGHAPTINTAVIGLVIGESVSMLISVLALYFRMCTETTSAKQETPISRFYAAKKLLTLSSPLSLSRIVINFLQSVEAVWLPLYLGQYGYDTKTALSVYGVLTGMALPLLFFPNALTGSMSVLLLPMVSEAESIGNYDKILHTVKKTIFSCVGLGLLCTFCFHILGNFIGTFLYKSSLAGKFIVALSPICPFLYLCTTLSSILHGLGKAMSVFFVNVSSLMLRLLFIAMLVPVFGIDCYILSMTLSQALSALLYMILLSRIWKKVLRHTNDCGIMHAE